jgi:hypothetical protein
LYWKLGLDFEQMCRKRDESNVIQTFECPQPFVSSEKKFCYGFTLEVEHWCEWSERSEDIFGMNYWPKNKTLSNWMPILMVSYNRVLKVKGN